MCFRGVHDGVKPVILRRRPLWGGAQPQGVAKLAVVGVVREENHHAYLKKKIARFHIISKKKISGQVKSDDLEKFSIS